LQKNKEALKETPEFIAEIVSNSSVIPKNKTNLTFSPFSLFVSFGESGKSSESVKIVRSFFW